MGRIQIGSVFSIGHHILQFISFFFAACDIIATAILFFIMDQYIIRT